MTAIRPPKNPRAPNTASAPVATPRLTAWAVYVAMASTPVASMLMAQSANAQSVERIYDIPAGPLSAALARFAAESGILLSANARLTDGRSTRGLKGKYGDEAGLKALLEGTGLAVTRGPTGYALEVVAPSNESTLPEVSVTGTADPFALPPETHGIKADYQDSATKTPLSIRETPQSISVITRDSMDARQAMDANSALELASGVTPGRSGHGGPFAGRGLGQGENFNLRGQDLNEDRDVRIDGFSASSSAFDLSAYERVEAVKGPSSMLYGQGSLGGFINLVRKKPQPDFAASVAAQAGSFDSRRVEGDITGAIDKEQKILGRFTATYDDSGSFIDGVKTRVAMIAPSLEMRLGESTRALLQVLYQDDRYIPSQGVPLKVEGNRAKAPDISRSTFVGIPSQQHSKAENSMESLKVDHELSDRWLGTLLLQTSRQDARRYFDSYGYSFTGLANGDVTMESDTAHIKNENWAGELRLDGRFDAFGREHQVLVGLEQNSRKNRTAFGYTYLGIANIYQGNFADFGTIPGGAANQPFLQDHSSKSTNQAVYGQVALSVLERTKLLVGTRFDSSKQKHTDNIGSTSDEKKDRAQTWRVGVTQDLTPNVTAYVSYAESFNPVDSFSSSGAILDPERGKGYEAGVKTEWFNKRLGVTAAVFRQDLDNRPIPDPNDPSGNFSISSGLQRTKGLELEISGSPIPGLTIGAAAAWFDSKHIDPEDPDFGLRPYDSVDHTATLFAGYEIQSGGWKGFGFGATYINVGKRSLSFAGSGALYGGSDELFVDGYERIDLNFSYKGLRDWRFALQVRNLTDEVYIERVRDASGSNYFGSPRAVLFRTEYRFH